MDTTAPAGEMIAALGRPLAGPESGVSSGAMRRILQAHAFDGFFHRAITETGTIDGRTLLAGIAERLAYELVEPAGTIREGTLIEAFSSLGLGRLAACEIGPGGGTATLGDSPFAATRLRLLGKASVPSCDVSRGVLAGILRRLHGSAFEVEEVACVAAGAPACRFNATSAGAPLPSDLDDEGWEAVETALAPPAEPPPAVLNALQPLLATDGRMRAVPPGGSYGRLWGRLYAEAARRFESAIPREMGSKFSTLAPIVLTEAGHLGTFHAFGSLLRSPEWRERIQPGLGNREASIHALVALVNALEWGRWSVEVLAPFERFTVRVHGGYEAAGHLAGADWPGTPSCYFSRGVVAGIMNLLYLDDAGEEAPLTTSLYNQLFRSPLSFRTTETRCVSAGDPFCEFVANPLSPGLRPNPFMR